MSNNNWYAGESWYAPLYNETPSKSSRGAKRRRLSFGWRLGIGLTLLVGLIVLSSLLFAGDKSDPGPDFFAEGQMPENWQDYFDAYYTEVEGMPEEYTLPRAENVPQFKLQFDKPQGEEMTLQQLYESCARVTVSLKGYTEGQNGFYWGTGVIISKDGLIVTNSHIISGCDSVTVTLYDDSEYEAALVGADTTSDIAVLKIEANGLPAAQFGDSAKLVVGDPVAAIGNPLGETFRMTLTNGIVSAMERGIDYNGSNMNLIQTNTALNQGTSGGALFNLYGEVIGITTAKYSGDAVESIGFAIPIDDVMPLLEEIQNNGYVSTPYMGISITDQFAGMGAYVVQVDKGSAAAVAGIRVGDLIVSMGEHSVSSVSTLSAAMRNFKPGDTTKITVFRSGALVELTITFGEKPHN